MARVVDTSLIIPAYNEEKIIAATLDKVLQYVKTHAKQLGETEIIVVAAGTDRTAAIARTYKDRANLTVVAPPRRAGKGRDVRVGFRAAKGEIQLFMDADLATPLHHVTETVARLRDGADIVIGVRDQFKIHTSKFRALLSSGGNILTRVMLLPRIKDTQCGYKGFTRQAANVLFGEQRLDGWGFDIEVLQLAKEHKFSVSQQPIDDWHEAREEGLRGDSIVKVGVKTLLDVLRLRLEAWNRAAGRWWVWWTIVAMAASFSLAMMIGLKQSVWFDEGYSILLAKASWGELVHLTSVDAHPPFYYMTLKLWTELFGTSEFALRSLSALAGALAIGVAVLLVRRMASVRAVVVVLPFLVLAPFLIRYDYEIRMYALVTLIGVSATYFLIRALDTRRKLWWVLYAALVALGMYTLYMSIVMWLAHLVWLTYRARRAGESMIRQPWWLAYIGAVIVFVPWIPTLVGQLTHSALPNITSPVTLTGLASVLGFTFSYEPSWWLGAWASLGIAVTLSLLIAQIARLRRQMTHKERGLMSLLVMLLLVPLGFFVVTSLPPLRPLFMERYLAHFIIFAYLMIGVVIALSWKYGDRRRASLLCVIGLIVLTCGVFKQAEMGNYNYQRLQRPEAQAARQMTGDCKDTVVVADDPFTYIDVAYYFGDCDLRFAARHPLEYRGGFAPLYGSPKLIGKDTALTAPRLIHIHWESRPAYSVPAGYALMRSQHVDKTYVDEYVRTTSE